MTTKSTGWDYNENDVRYVTAGGETHTGNEVWWEQEFDGFERLGVPAELIELAKPLLDGNNKEQQFAREFLMERQGTHNASLADVRQLSKVLSDRGHMVPTVSDRSEDDVLKAWEDQLGPAQDKRGGDFTLGTSKEASRNALSRHGYPSGAGAQTTQPRAKFVQQSDD